MPYTEATLQLLSVDGVLVDSDRTAEHRVLVDALTTILGFGALMVASHRGLESLGRVLTLGVTTCTFTALVLLPAILSILRPAKAEQD
jgi:predicted RND superfamily exporter protein